MRVYLLVPSTTYEKYKPTYTAIGEVITKTGHTLFASLDDSTYQEMGLGMLDQEDWKLLAEREMLTLEQSDVVIVNGSDKATFGVGYQVRGALDLHKPTLLLLHKKSVQGSFISGLVHPSLHREIFDEHNLDRIVSSFLSNKRTED